ncbi:MAG: hypothetical protein ABIR58_09340 [Gemmatimonadaceae bacterium]
MRLREEGAEVIAAAIDLDPIRGEAAGAVLRAEFRGVRAPGV